MQEQLILIGLVLDADDYGRGVAHATILGRKLGVTPEQIAPALETAATRGLCPVLSGGATSLLLALPLGRVAESQ